MNIRNMIFVLSLGLVSLVPEVQAVCGNTNSTTGQSYCTSPIKQLYLSGDGGLYIKSDGDLAGVSCELESGVFWHIPRTDPHYQERYSMLLVAAATGQTMHIVTVNGNIGTACSVGYIVMEN